MKSNVDLWDEPVVRRLIKSRNGLDPELIVQAYADSLIAESGSTRLPIDVEAIASLQGIRTRVRAYDFAGRIYAEESGQLVMDLNATDSVPRRRFTAAHELMHTAFPGFKRDARYRVDDFTEGHQRHRAQEEYLCDMGAAALLMPRSLVAGQYWADDGLKAVEKLASDADVSLEAAGNRIVALSATPVVFLVLEVMNKPADETELKRGVPVEPRLRVKYATARGLDLFVPRFKSADANSVLARALVQGEPTRGVEKLPGISRGPEFSIEAKAYPHWVADQSVARVLAIATAADSARAIA